MQAALLLNRSGTGPATLCTTGRRCHHLRNGFPSRLSRPNRRLQFARTCRGAQVIRAAIFGVGAPEALLVGVVALVVFGPKGLAQAVKSLGKTLRTFQPTIRELASVSNELKNTLTEQIGLDDIRNEFRQGASTPLRDAFPEDVSKGEQKQSGAEEASPSRAGPVAMAESDPDIARKRAESRHAAWGAQEVPKASRQMEEMSLQELKAELERRRQAAKTPDA